MKKIVLDKDSLANLWRRFPQFMLGVLRWALLDQVRMLGIGVLVIGAFTSLGLVVILLFVQSSEEQVEQAALTQGLASSTINELIMRFEQLQRENEIGLQLPSRELFSRQD